MKNVVVPHLNHYLMEKKEAFGGLHGNFRASYLSFQAALLRTVQADCDSYGDLEPEGDTLS